MTTMQTTGNDEEWEDSEPYCRVCNKTVNRGDGLVCDEHYQGLWFLNVYAVTRHFGGREEGGWWYNSGELIASLPYENLTAAEEDEKRVADLFKANGYEYGNIYSVLGGQRLELTINREMGCDWPERTPHYE